jgi:hypothetical protein
LRVTNSPPPPSSTMACPPSCEVSVEKVTRYLPVFRDPFKSFSESSKVPVWTWLATPRWGGAGPLRVPVFAQPPALRSQPLKARCASLLDLLNSCSRNFASSD